MRDNKITVTAVDCFIPMTVVILEQTHGVKNYFYFALKKLRPKDITLHSMDCRINGRYRILRVKAKMVYLVTVVSLFNHQTGLALVNLTLKDPFFHKANGLLPISILV